MPERYDVLPSDKTRDFHDNETISGSGSGAVALIRREDT